MPAMRTRCRESRTPIRPTDGWTYNPNGDLAMPFGFAGQHTYQTNVDVRLHGEQGEHFSEQSVGMKAFFLTVRESSYHHFVGSGAFY